MGLFSRTKKIRSTQEADTLRNVFSEDYKIYLKIEQSEDLKRYLELAEYINSPVFKENKKKIDDLAYKGSKAYEAEKRFKSLLKNKKLRHFYLIKDSSELQGYLRINESPLYEEFTNLRALVKSPGFDKKLRIEEYNRYGILTKDEKLKAAIKFEKNSAFKHYLEIVDSELPEEFEQLDTYIRSDAFRNERDYLLNKKRYLTTDDYKLFCEHEDLKNRSDITKYFRLHADINFQNMIKWDLVFSDEFNGNEIDPDKWIMRYYPGERLLQDTYGVGNDVQLFTNENVSVQNSSALLQFNKENITGKYWDTKLGIIEKSYAYSSGMLSTAAAYRQLYGRFEAKIKVNRSAVKQLFWMRGDEELPHILIMENGVKGISMGSFYLGKEAIVRNAPLLKELKLNNEFYIFTLEWDRKKITWKINDTVVKEITENIPTTPLYIGFSLQATTPPASKHIPATMEIDWVRFYQLR